MTMAEVVEAITRERARLLAAVESLEERATTLSVTDEGWTAKDLLAHLIHWATQVAFGLGAAVQPPMWMLEERKRREAAGIDRGMPTGDESNALAVAHFRERSLDEVRAMFEGLVDALTERARLRSDDEMNAPAEVPWAGTRPLWEFIGGDTFLHWPVHAEAIERAGS